MYASQSFNALIFVRILPSKEGYHRRRHREANLRICRRSIVLLSAQRRITTMSIISASPLPKSFAQCWSVPLRGVSGPLLTPQTQRFPASFSAPLPAVPDLTGVVPQRLKVIRDVLRVRNPLENGAFHSRAGAEAEEEPEREGAVPPAASAPIPVRRAKRN